MSEPRAKGAEVLGCERQTLLGCEPRTSAALQACQLHDRRHVERLKAVAMKLSQRSREFQPEGLSNGLSSRALKFGTGY